MDYLNDLKPGKRENAFYVKSNTVDNERVGVQSLNNRKIYIYVWDSQKKKHVGKYIDRDQYDILS